MQCPGLHPVGGWAYQESRVQDLYRKWSGPGMGSFSQSPRTEQFGGTYRVKTGR